MQYSKRPDDLWPKSTECTEVSYNEASLYQTVHIFHRDEMRLNLCITISQIIDTLVAGLLFIICVICYHGLQI